MASMNDQSDWSGTVAPMGDHLHWLATMAGASVSGVLAMAADVPWGLIFPVIGMAVAAIGPPLVKMWRDYQIARIEIRARERELESKE